MILIPFLHFFCFLVCASLAVYVLYQDWKSLLSRTCAILLCCFAIWNFGDIIVQNYDNSITANFATIIQNIASIGWIGFASAILCFSLAFAKQDELLRRIWFQILVISIPLFLMYLQWSGWLLVNPEKKPYGWFFDWSDSIWSYVFFAYYSVFTICSIVITYYHGRRTKKSLIRKQANIIFVSVTASLVIGSIFDVILPEMGISAFPTIANLFIFVFVIGLFYAIVRYRFLTITPAFAAENIISFMDELLILMSPLGKIVTVNKATLEVLQYNQADLENKSFSILAPNESGEENLFEKILKEETIKNGDGTLHSKTGKQIPIIYSCTFLKNEGGETIGVVFIARDITEHKHAENELRENEEKLRNILNSSPDAITISDLAGNITACNQATADLHGFGSEKDVIGCNCLSLIAPKSHLAAIEASAKLLQGSIIKGIEFTLRNCNGSEFPGEVSASVLRDAVGQPAAIICISKNISERKKIEVELRKSMQKAEESNRLKSAFLANMSHEIRTPMNGILGFAELLKRPNLSKKQQQDFIIMIEQSGTRLMNIINDVINLSKLEAGMTQVKISESNINDQMDFICSFFKPEASQKGIELSFDKPLPVGDSVIYTDKEKIYAILTNLVKNAIKFTNEGFIEIGCKKKNKSIEFFIIDSGVGIPQELKDIIFERFRQGSEALNRNYEGSGLGLSISKSYVELLGGKIWVNSEEGKGSTFSFTTPCNIQSPEGTEVESPLKSGDSKDDQKIAIKILIADDDAINRTLLSMNVKSFSKDVLVAKDGVEAVQIFQSNSDIDLILMDIKMPKMNGLDATKQIRQFNQNVIIFALTAYALGEYSEKAIQAGCNEYLTKPISLFSFNRLMARYFSSARNLKNKD